MSFKLFDQGYTAEQIKGMHKPTQDELMTEKLRKWAESEHVLGILRSIKASTEIMNQLEAEAWAKVIKRRR